MHSAAGRTLADHRVGAGDQVALLAPNDDRLVLALLACWWLGLPSRARSTFAGARPNWPMRLRKRPQKPWKDIWGCGQGIAAVTLVVPAAALVERIRREYCGARQRLAETALSN
jgi:hypothetical protein